MYAQLLKRFGVKPVVACIRMSGVIVDQRGTKAISHSRFHETLDRAFKIPMVKAVALCINSPGGSPAQSSLIGNTVRRLSQERKIPVYAFVEDAAASGGYWLACAADEIYAQKSSIVGSVGVISQSFGLKDFIERYGVERRVHTSGENKSSLDPFLDENPDDVEHLKQLQSEIHEQFKDWVKERRGVKLSAPDEQLFEGRYWTGEKALQLGLIDGIGDMKGVLREQFGSDVKFKNMKPTTAFGELFGGGVMTDIVGNLQAKNLWARLGL